MASGLIGAIRVDLTANTANFSQGMKRAQREAATSVGAIQKTFATARASVVGDLKRMAGGIAAGFAISSLANMATQALEYASSLGEVAQQLGVTTEALQVYRYAAGQVGISQEEMDKGLAKFTKTTGEAANGTKAAANAFNDLHVNVRTAAGSIKDSDQLLREVADGLAQIKDPAERARIEVQLFGRAGQRLDTLLSGGSKRIQELREEAHRLGLVLSEEQIRKADETADKLRRLKDQLNARIAGAVADNASAILKLADALASLINWLAKASKAYDSFLAHLQIAQGIAYQVQGGAMQAATFGVFGKGARRQGEAMEAYGREDLARLQMEKKLGVSWQDVVASNAALPDLAGATGDNAVGGGGGKSKKEKADEIARKAQEAARRALDVQGQITESKVEELRAQQDVSEDYVDRAALAAQMVDLETDQRQRELDYQVRFEGLDPLIAKEIAARMERVRILEKQAINDQVELDRQRDYEETERLRYGMARDLLEGEAALADTAAERRKVELQILDLAYRERRERLQRIIDESKNADEVNRARYELDRLGQQEKVDRAGVLKGTRGPLETVFADFPTTAAKMNQAFEQIAAGGLNDLVEGLTDAITGAKSLGEVFKGLANTIVQALVKIGIQWAISKAFQALSGLAGVGSSGGMFGMNPTAGPIGMAGGGSFTVLGNKGFDTNLLSVNGVPVARVSYGEAVNVANDNPGRGGTTVIVNAQDAVLAQTVRGWIADGMVAATQAGSADAIGKMARSNQRRLA